MSLTFDEAQKDVDDYISQFEEGYWPELTILARLVEEVGELSRELNNLHGEKKRKSSDKKELEMEIGDILFSLICLSNKMDIDLDESFNSVLNKYRERDQGRWDRKQDQK